MIANLLDAGLLPEMNNGCSSFLSHVQTGNGLSSILTLPPAFCLIIGFD